MSDLPLSDVKIADFSWVGAGPRATKDLADYGAQVVKIESRKRLDLGRLSPPFAGDRKDPDGSAFFAITNTSKQGVTLNLSDPSAADLAKKLVAWADVVVENFSKGYMERIGLGYDTLKAIKPDIIMVSVSVAGRAGPASDLRGYGNVAAAMSGLAALSGWADRGPHMPPFAYGDVIAPMFATVATLAALEHRRRTGEGQHVDISQLEPLVHVLADEFARAQAEPGFAKLANSTPAMAPHGVWPGRDGRWIAIAVDGDAAWTKLAALAGIDPALGATLEDRHTHVAEIGAQLAKWTAGHDVHELADQLAALGIAAEAVQNGRDLCEDHELRASGHFHRIHHEKLGACDMPGPPLHFSDAAIRVGAPPMLGEHNDAVFGDLLGLAPEEIERLTAEGVLG
ncbi:MAG: CaiB/BaiF CoA transferase family protein [Allosphingosinicella sp.]